VVPSKLLASLAGGRLDEVEDAGEVRQKLGVRVGVGVADGSTASTTPPRATAAAPRLLPQARATHKAATIA
jgi:hypothetical protein